MFSKRYESTEGYRRTWLHVPSGTPWSTSSDTNQVVEIKKETFTKMYTPLKYSFGSTTPNWTAHLVNFNIFFFVFHKLNLKTLQTIGAGWLTFHVYIFHNEYINILKVIQWIVRNS